MALERPVTARRYTSCFRLWAGERARASGGRVFADVFAWRWRHRIRAAHRPSGVAVDPTSSLSSPDDVRGRIYRDRYYRGRIRSGSGARGHSVSTLRRGMQHHAVDAKPPAGHSIRMPVNAPQLRKPSRSEWERPGIWSTGVDRRLPRSKSVGGATCTGCHGARARATTPRSQSHVNQWLLGDGQLQVTIISETITPPAGAGPKQYRSPRPHMGGHPLPPISIGGRGLCFGP